MAKADFKPFIDGAINAFTDSLMNNPAYPVVVGCQVELMKHGIKPREAWDMSRDAIAEFLKDEGVKVGHRDYAWTVDGGAEIAQAYVIDHFESKRTGP